MAAQIVQQFCLPLRKPPAACDDAKAFIAVADGPSSGEYDLESLRNCRAQKFCYGRVARSIPPDMYALADPGFAEVLQFLAPTRVLISKDGPYGGPRGQLRYWDELPKDRGHDYQWAPADCAHHPVLNCLRLGASKVFLLGYDGYYRNDGRLSSAPHAEQLIDTPHISDVLLAQHPVITKNANFWVADINRISWDITIKATHKVRGIQPEIYNLSFGSRHRPVWDVHPEVLSQPFRRIDRRGEAMVVHILDTDAEIEGLEMPHVVPRARWGPLHVSNHADFINGLRRIEPRLAIYVRTHAKLEMLANLLADDIQVGDLNARLGDGLHRQVSHYRLPPINENSGAAAR